MQHQPTTNSQILSQQTGDLPAGLAIGRLRRTDNSPPCVVRLLDGIITDITCAAAPTVRDICEMEDPAGYLRAASGEKLGVADDFAILGMPLAPVDLQVVKAAGVTFIVSMLERVIEEQVDGDTAKANALRAEITTQIGGSLANVIPGSDKARSVKKMLQKMGMWSQYLEVGIGADPEVFTKAPPMAAVGHLARIGINPISSWNNSEPEIALAVSSQRRIVGAMLANDVNLRDVEGRSALLLGKAKDNNASCALGPLLRLFDDDFSLDNVRGVDVRLQVIGTDDYELVDISSMAQISRSPEDLVAATCGDFHQYPDGFILLLGTMFAPIDDRSAPGMGFTHKIGDIVEIAADGLGALRNQVHYCQDCPPWTYGASHLMRDLARTGLLTT